MAPVSRAPVVLYSGGTGRSGCTVLASVLGQVPGFVNVGEARYVWQKGLIDNRLCGCGARFRDCAYWHSVGDAAYGGWDAIDPGEVEQLRRTVDHPARFPELMLPRALRRRGFEADAARFAEILRPLYRAIAEVADARVVVDSSRFATYALLLARTADVRMVHVVRDSRGVAFSWQKKVAVTDSPDKPIYLPTYSVASGSARWAAYNLQTSMTRLAGLPYLFARYEDAVADPGPYLEQMMAHAGEALDGSVRPLDGNRLLLSRPMHTVMGNPVRLERGSISIRVDDQWQAEMAPRARRTVTVMTLPLLVRYRYPLRPRAAVVPFRATGGNGAANGTGHANAHANGHANGHGDGNPRTHLASFVPLEPAHADGNGNGHTAAPHANGNGHHHANGHAGPQPAAGGNGRQVVPAQQLAQPDVAPETGG